MQNLLRIEAELLSFIMLASLFKYNSRNKKQNGYRLVAGIYGFALAMGALSLVFLAFGESIFAVKRAQFLFPVLSGAMGILWLFYCDKKFDRALEKAKGLRALAYLPTVLSTILVALTKNRAFELVNLVYVALPLASALLSRRRSLSKRSKRERFQLARAALPVAFAALVQTAVPKGLPLMTISLFFTLLVLFINSQYRKIIVDNLTKLPNRYGMDEEIEEQLEQYRKDKNDSFYIIACDMDNFKQINDTWGHAEGDRALKMIADVLIKVADENNSMAFRIGGDEFVIITDTCEYGLAESICKQLKNLLEAIDFRDDFDIRMSMGVALYDGGSTISELMNTADLSLYKVKRQSKGEEECHV